MAYEFRVGGVSRAQFATQEEALEAAKQALLEDPNSDAEVIDLATGRAAAPGASKRWRDELRNKVGF